MTVVYMCIHVGLQVCCMHSPRPTGYIFDRGWAIKKCMLVVPVCVMDKADHLVEEKKRLWP